MSARDDYPMLAKFAAGTHGCTPTGRWVPAATFEARKALDEIDCLRDAVRLVTEVHRNEVTRLHRERVSSMPIEFTGYSAADIHAWLLEQCADLNPDALKAYYDDHPEWTATRVNDARAIYLHPTGEHVFIPREKLSDFTQLAALAISRTAEAERVQRATILDAIARGVRT
jgi:hypothetical protein